MINLKEYMKEYNQKPEVKNKRKAYEKRPEVKEMREEYHKEYNKKLEVKNMKKGYRKKYRKNNPEKIRAQKLAQKIPLKSACEICGYDVTGQLERHHWRYDKPLMVNTLCKFCHEVQHIKNTQ